MAYFILALLFIMIAFLPHINPDKLYVMLLNVIKNVIPVLIIEIEKVVTKAGVKKEWEKILLFWFMFSFPVGFLYFIISANFFKVNILIYACISFSPFLVYFFMLIWGIRRKSIITRDVRQVYRALKLVVRAGGNGEEALKKSIKYTSILRKALEGVLINWGEAEYELMKLRQKYRIIEVENLVAYLLEIKKGVSKDLIDNIERQEQQLALAHSREVAKANKRDDDIAQISFALMLIAQFYLVAMPLLNENIRTFQGL